MYIVLKHYMSIDSYSIERILQDKADAIVLCSILNKSESNENVEYIIYKKIELN